MNLFLIVFCPLKWLLSDSYIKIDGFIGSSSPNGGFSQVDIAICTIEKANSLINRVIDNDAIFEIGIVTIVVLLCYYYLIIFQFKVL